MRVVAKRGLYMHMIGSHTDTCQAALTISLWRTGNVKCEVVGFMRKIMNGGYYPWAPKSGAGYVDIDDVAAAHTLAMVTPKASGR